MAALAAPGSIGHLGLASRPLFFGGDLVLDSEEPSDARDRAFDDLPASVL
jgi:hypothetical protein